MNLRPHTERVGRIAAQGLVWGAVGVGVIEYVQVQGSPVPVVHDQSIHASYYSNGGSVTQHHVDVDRQLSREYPAVRGGWKTRYVYRDGSLY